MSKNSIIEFKNVYKKIGSKDILSNISFEVNKGEVIGIIGSNGSGKTTLLRLASGLSYSTSGEIRFNNKLLNSTKDMEIPHNIGILIENPIFIQNMTGFKNLYYLSKIRNEIGKQDVLNSMKKVGLDPNSKKLVSEYSLGMRQRLGIAQAIMENPELLLLDEPTNGLDETGFSLFEDIIKEFKNKNSGIIIVSHDMNSIKKFCDRVYLVEDKKLILQNKIKDFKVELENIEDIEKILKIKGSYVEGIKEGKATVIVPYSNEDISTIIDSFNISYNIV
ncbi:ABC transporter ATP-binding protein [Clostridioides difficile]|nr:ABC transporter ATP-binding protein [Clostridioides difficile]MBZ0632402.1 ABC transporter ATP-binding protein [Clostridioides difficile]MBZ0658260.1 ABC transporter ATP-binding protein [Clostridioides difficile]HBF9262881.1 ABC transporter ATP-binding protein [Clostridioides difficile]HBF9360004.1 ABC transporter ATP-binding protein [Clostridioides difficile]